MNDIAPINDPTPADLNKRHVRHGSAATGKAAFTSLLANSLAKRGDGKADDTLKAQVLKPLSAADFAGGRIVPDHTTLQKLTTTDPRTTPTVGLRPMDELDRIPGVKQTVSPEKSELTRQTEKWVAQTFYGTMLKQMRNSPFKSDLFSGGHGGESFNEMFDQTLADRMARGAGGKLVKSIVRALEKKAGGAATVQVHA